MDGMISEVGHLAVVVDAKVTKTVRILLENNGLFDDQYRIAPFKGTNDVSLGSIIEKWSPEEPRLMAIPVVGLGGGVDEWKQSLQAFLESTPFEVVVGVSLPTSKKHNVTSPQQQLAKRLVALVTGVSVDEVVETIPKKWEEHGDLILFPANSFSHPALQELGWDRICNEVVSAMPRFKRVAMQDRVGVDLMRKPQAKLLLGDNGLVEHIDNGITYCYDLTKLMFSRGNVSEKIRVANFPCEGEIVVDMYAGIGYFTLPYLVHANVKKLYACEWNPDAVAMLKQNLVKNKVASERYEVHPGDNAQFPYSDIADRINLGLIPSSQAGWTTAARILNKTHGGWLHVHENVTFKEQSKEEAYNDMGSFMTQEFKQLLKSHDKREGVSWAVHIHHIERVKSYAPFVDHLVYDIECRPTTSKENSA